MTEYNTTNKGSLWNTKAVKGSGNINGQQYSVYLIATELVGENKPSHILFMAAFGDQNAPVIRTALFRDTTDNKRYLNGSIVAPDGSEHWVNVFLNEQQNEKSPVAGMTFQPKEPKPAPAQTSEQWPPPDPGMPSGDDIPF